MGKDSFSFSVPKKKTPFQRHKEAEEEKKRRADEEAAKLYEEFVESFKAEEESGPKTFVRGGTIQPGQSEQPQEPSSAPAKKGGGKYVPSFIPPSLAAALVAKGEPADEKEESVFPLPSSSKSDKSKPRNIDLMLENLKREQEIREERQRLRREGKATLFDLPPDESMGSFDDGDPFTTNLYVGNLAPDVDEEVMKKEFGRFGPIASVKIMWPRSDDERKRGRNCGFVAFMRRDDAQRAKDELNGIMLKEQELKIGWGKAVPIPAVPIYPPQTGGMKGASVPPPGSGSGSGSAPPWATYATSEPEEPPAGFEIEVTVPEDARIRYVIDTLAAYVLRDGCNFEQAVMEREQDNVEFSFLFQLQSPKHAYYRWRLFSLAQGDSLKSWRVEPFYMVEGGPQWIPPHMTLSDGSHQTAAQRGGESKDRDKPLSDLQRDKFEDLLRGLNMERASISAAMVFALDNAESAFDLVEILTESLTLSETPVLTKVARLFLVSDILHNSTAQVRNASRYRSWLEDNLPDIFESLQETYRHVESRMTQEILRRHVLRVLRVWRDWFIFADDYLNGLQATFLRNNQAEFKPNAKLAEELKALPLDDLESKARRNGLSRKGGQESILDRFLALDYYLHGEALPEPPPVAPVSTAPSSPTHDNTHLALAAEGPPAANTVAARIAQQVIQIPLVDMLSHKGLTLKEATAPKEPVSKWTLVDYDDNDDNQQATAPKQDSDSEDIFSNAGDTPIIQPGTTAPDVSSPEAPDRRESKAADRPAEGAGGVERVDAAEEERRQKLRQVEVAVMMYREDLEDGGLSKEEVEKKVAEHRTKLAAEAEKVMSGKDNGKSGKDNGKSENNRHTEKESKDKRKDKERDSERDRSTKDKERDKERERERDKEKDKDREKDKEKEKDKDRERRKRARSRSRSAPRKRSRSRSPKKSKSPARNRGRTARDKDREKDRDKDREKDRDKDREKDRDKDREKDRDKDREKEDREKVREKDRDKDRDKDREKERDREREREKDKSKDRGSPRHKDSKKEKSRGRSRSRTPRRKDTKKDSKRHRS